MSIPETVRDAAGDDESGGSELNSTISFHRQDQEARSSFSVSGTQDLPKAINSDGDQAKTHKAVVLEPNDMLQVGQFLLDRYEIRDRLGKGGFGAVFSAYDRHLKRVVAIKQSRFLKSFVSGQVRDEARAIAALNHPNIVQIHDLIERGDHEWLIIMECLEGAPLSGKLRQTKLAVSDAVRLGLEIADALVHAHGRHLVHSDLKPANVFVCNDGRVKLLDFGLAVGYFPEQDSRRLGGTPGYMSPEQIRGEFHLIDGRTDIWAFGVVLYEMLTGVKPFAAKDPDRAKARTLSRFATPPRQLNPDIDNELQRIVLKCLEPLILSRYKSAAELRDDLAHWFETYGDRQSSLLPNPHRGDLGTDSVPSSLRLSKRGLQPFTENDSSVYFSLIPGPKDRNGVPDSLRFWKRWVESDDPNTEHPVGVLYGPSGSGKTSYVRAGLFQQLPTEVCRVYVECRPGDLGGRLTRIIESQTNTPSTESSLRDLLHRIRSGDDDSRGFHKLLIVLDQFESWAINASLEERLDLAEALRQCDGNQIRALVVTRDDYWAGVQELLHWLEIPIREGRNVASVDLLAPRQAEQILEAIGRESGTLPPDDQPLSKDQRHFITQSVEELAINGKVICVHLVMFAKMVSLQHWTPRALRESGGVGGACSLFFHELFGSSDQASPEYKRIAPLVPVILGQLVPSESDTVAEVCKQHASLVQAARQCNLEHLLGDGLRLLDEDLRIITLIGGDLETEHPGSLPSQPQYRISHDFLVEPIKAYLARSRKGNWRSRTMGRLVEMSDLWSRRPNAAYLPSFSEYLILSFGTVAQPRSEHESRFLRAATRLHAGRISAAVVALLGFLIMSLVAWNQWTQARAARTGELNANVARVLDAPPDKFVDRVSSLDRFADDAIPIINVWTTSQDPDIRLRSNLYSQHATGKSFAPLAPQLHQAAPEWFDLVLSIARKTPDATDVLSEVAARGAEAAATMDRDLETIDEAVRTGDRAAILLAYLGDTDALLTRLSGSDHMARDQAFLDEALQWRGAPQLWADLIQNETTPDVRYHAGVVLGSYPQSQLATEALQLEWASLVNSVDASTHSIARYLAKHFGQDVTSIPLQPPAGANWRRGPNDMSMVRFEPKDFVYRLSKVAIRKQDQERDLSISVTRPFWAATTPVPEQMYREFAAAMQNEAPEFDSDRQLNRFNLPDYLINDPLQPAVAVSLDQTYAFCNWLSRTNGLQECYAPREVQTPATASFEFPPIPWSFDQEANGYRVPTKDEFFLMVECGYRHPENTLALSVAVAAGYPRMSPPHPREAFTLIPNRSGIFLMDTYCGTYICDDPTVVYYGMSDTGPLMNLLRNPIAPIGGIFLVQNADKN